MIITCSNCNKKFNINSNLITDKGRLLQCGSCNHKWFFKNEILEKNVSSINDDSINIFDENSPTINNEINLSELRNEKFTSYLQEEVVEKIEINQDVLEEKTEVNLNKDTCFETKPKNPKNFKILNIFIVTIISFVGFIIIIDTFKYPIGKVVPSIEFILYNLYESIKDISLFIKDLT